MDIKQALQKVKWKSPILQLLYLYLVWYQKDWISEEDLIKMSCISKQWIDKHYEILLKNNFFIPKSSTDDLTNKTA